VTKTLTRWAGVVFSSKAFADDGLVRAHAGAGADVKRCSREEIEQLALHFRFPISDLVSLLMV
jgi:hypothetical protein